MTTNVSDDLQTQHLNQGWKTGLKNPGFLGY